jgi:hypothetical protein
MRSSSVSLGLATTTGPSFLSQIRGFGETEDDLFNGRIPLRQNLTSQDLTCYLDLMDATPGAEAPILE